MTRLQVVISDHCLGCEQAISLSRSMAERFPDLVVEVVNVDDPQAVKPAPVVAVPAYLLDGAPIFLGNPSQQELVERLARG